MKKYLFIYFLVTSPLIVLAQFNINYSFGLTIQNTGNFLEKYHVTQNSSITKIAKTHKIEHKLGGSLYFDIKIPWGEKINTGTSIGVNLAKFIYVLPEFSTSQSTTIDLVSEFQTFDLFLNLLSSYQLNSHIKIRLDLGVGTNLATRSMTFWRKEKQFLTNYFEELAEEDGQFLLLSNLFLIYKLNSNDRVSIVLVYRQYILNIVLFNSQSIRTIYYKKIVLSL